MSLKKKVAELISLGLTEERAIEFVKGVTFDVCDAAKESVEYDDIEGYSSEPNECIFNDLMKK